MTHFKFQDGCRISFVKLATAAIEVLAQMIIALSADSRGLVDVVDSRTKVNVFH